jgi:hypothetical protein
VQGRGHRHGVGVNDSSLEIVAHGLGQHRLLGRRRVGGSTVALAAIAAMTASTLAAAVAAIPAVAAVAGGAGARGVPPPLGRKLCPLAQRAVAGGWGG